MHYCCNRSHCAQIRKCCFHRITFIFGRLYQSFTAFTNISIAIFHIFLSNKVISELYWRKCHFPFHFSGVNITLCLPAYHLKIIFQLKCFKMLLIKCAMRIYKMIESNKIFKSDSTDDLSPTVLSINFPPTSCYYKNSDFVVY